MAGTQWLFRKARGILHRLAPSARDSRRLFRMIEGYRGSMLVYFAAKAGIPDKLAHGPQSAGKLAALCGLEAPLLLRLLRGLAAIGLVTYAGDDRFALTRLGRHLQSGVRNSLSAAAVLHGELFYPAWQGLFKAAQTGKAAFEHVFSASLFDYLRNDPQMEDLFHRYISAKTRRVARDVARAYHFPSVVRFVDIGGGEGVFARELLIRYPRATAVVFDAPHHAARAAQRGSGLDRCVFQGGDFLRDRLPQGDFYILKWVLHDWDDKRCVDILSNVRRSMDDTRTLLVIEEVVPESGRWPARAVAMDIAMLALSGGRERTEKEYGQLFSSSGFRLSRIISCPMARVMEVKPL